MVLLGRSSHISTNFSGRLPPPVRLQYREREGQARSADECQMDFPPEHYFQTATERMRQSQHLYEEGASFALAIYVGGLAVECLRRASIAGAIRHLMRGMICYACSRRVECCALTATS